MFTKHQLLYHIMLICKRRLSVIRYFFTADFLHNLFCTSCTIVLYIYIAGISSYAWEHRCSLLDLCSGTTSTTLRPQLGDFVARSSTYARGLPQSLSDHSSGTSLLASRPVLGDCLNHSLTIAWGLRRSLLDLCSATASTTLRS